MHFSETCVVASITLVLERESCLRLNEFDIGIVSLWCIVCIAYCTFFLLLFFDRSTSRNLLGITNLFNIAYCLARANRHTGTNGTFDRMLKTLTNCNTFPKMLTKNRRIQVNKSWTIVTICFLLSNYLTEVHLERHSAANCLLCDWNRARECMKR